VMAQALQKVYSASPLWTSYVPQAMVHLLNNGRRSFINASTAFLERFRDEPRLVDQVLADSTNIPTHPTDSHPALQDRLSSLGQSVGQVVLSAGNDSVGLFADLDSVERDLTDLVTALLAQTHPGVERSDPETAAS
jgi:hypothetical protein